MQSLYEDRNDYQMVTGMTWSLYGRCFCSSVIVTLTELPYSCSNDSANASSVFLKLRRNTQSYM